jgi:hypothetical protein
MAQCCVANHGFLAQPQSQPEHDLIKARLTTREFNSTVPINSMPILVDGETTNSYWLGAVDFYGETSNVKELF